MDFFYNTWYPQLRLHCKYYSRPLLSKFRQEMDADKLLIYLQRIYCARVLFVCIVCIRQYTRIPVECFDIDRCILSSFSCKRLLFFRYIIQSFVLKLLQNVLPKVS